MDSNVTLGAGSLEALPETFHAPGYDRSGLARSIVHIGVGGFHRAHLATYIDELCRAGHTDWAIIGSGVLPGDAAMAAALGSQDTLFTVVERGAETTTTTVVGSMVDYLHASPDPSELIRTIASSTTRMVSLTVTEGGYPVDDATGEFDPASPNAGDASAFSILVAALDERRRAEGGPLSIVSCDNIMSNGDVTKRVTLAMADAVDPALAAWVQANVAFPNSMVDRITPATSDADRAWLTETHGVVDAWPVVCEPFRQWVIEDDFAGGRPPWEELDIILTDDVAPYERMKLQLLNAGHSCLAYAAGLLAIEFVHDAMADEDVLAFVRAYLEHEAKTSLEPVAGMDFDEYVDVLLERFANPQIRDQVARLCQDGSGKLPKFVIPTLRTHLDNDGPIDLAVLLIATWCEYMRGVDDNGDSFEPAPDPLSEAVRAAAARSVDDPTAILSVDAVFDPAIARHPRVRAALADRLSALRVDGVRSSLRAAIEGAGGVGGTEA